MALIDSTRMQQALQRIKSELDDRDGTIEEIQGTVTEVEGDVSDLKSALNDAPTEETGQELLAAMEENANWTWGMVLALEYQLSRQMPQDETLAEIAAALEDGNDIMDEYFALVAAERV